MERCARLVSVTHELDATTVVYTTKEGVHEARSHSSDPLVGKWYSETLIMIT